MNEAASLDHLFVNDVPLIDVRAPVEFERGAFPRAVNLPILGNDERAQVGICYKENGPEAARQLGHQLISGQVKRERIGAWQQFLDANPDAHLYCFRGGDRSSIACKWLAESGYPVPRIPGGYKAMRQHLIAVFDYLPALTVVAGKTGTGKTLFLESFSETIDLEAIARHRGSAFGRRIEDQPAQVDFENAVAIEFIRKRGGPFLLLEDEGRLIGRVHVPLPLQEKMRAAPLLLIEESIDARTGLIFDEYIARQWQEYETCFGDHAFDAFTEYLLTAVDAIKKRLGNVAHMEIRGQIESALAAQQTGDLSRHRDWIERLLVDYYDPMYEYQLEKKRHRITARGSRGELDDWVRENLKP